MIGDCRSIVRRRRMVGINDPVLDRLDRRRRKVDDHEALAEIARIGAKPDEVRLSC